MVDPGPFLVFVLLALLLTGLTPAMADDAKRGLLFRSGEITSFRERIKKDGPCRRAWDHLRRRADKLLNAKFTPETEAERGRGQHGNYARPSRQIQEMGHVLGFAWAVTGQRRYADKLRQGMLYYTGYRRWAGKAFSTWDPPWHSELTTAHFMMGYGVGYDFIRDHLTAEDRRTIIEAMVRLGVRPAIEDWLGPTGRVHALDSMGHNWWSVCVAGAGVAAVAIEQDHPEARGWADRVADAFPEWFAYPGNVLQNKMPTFDRTGGFYESVAYADFALRLFYRFRMAYRNARPRRAAVLDQIPELRGIPEFLLQTTYPTRTGVLTVNFGDAEVGGAVSGVVTLSAARDAEPAVASGLRWYFSRTSGHPRNVEELPLFEPDAPARLPVSLPMSRHWPDMGWAVLRDSWEPDATLLGVKCGDTWNHAHADAGSFILWTRGRPVLIDSGTCSYGRREYGGYFCQSRAHNVVLLDGRGQPRDDLYRGSKFRGRIPVLLDNDPLGTQAEHRLRAVLADATGPTADLFARNHRTFVWADRVIIVLDELQAHGKGHYEWLLHHDGEAKVSQAVRRVAVKAGPAGATVETVWPEQVAYKRRKGHRDHKPDEQVTYLAIVTPEPADRAEFVTAIVPQGQAPAPLPVFERLQGPHHVGTAWQDAGVRTEVYLNLRADGRRMHRNSNAVIGPWRTDAYLLVVQRPASSDPTATRRTGTEGAGLEDLTRFLVLGGSYLRCGQDILLDSLAKVHAIWEPGADPPRLTVAGPAARRIGLRSKDVPKTLTVNGKPVAPARYDKANKLVVVKIADAVSGGT